MFPLKVYTFLVRSNSAHFLHYLFRLNSSHFLHFFPLKFRSFLAFFISLKFPSFLHYFLLIPLIPVKFRSFRSSLAFFERNLSGLLDLGETNMPETKIFWYSAAGLELFPGISFINNRAGN